jgi:hypothetical protein
VLLVQIDGDCCLVGEAGLIRLVGAAYDGRAVEVEHCPLAQSQRRNADLHLSTRDGYAGSRALHE